MKNLIGVVVALALIGGGYLLYTQQQTIAKLTTNQIEPISTPTTIPDDFDTNQPASPTTQVKTKDDVQNIATSPTATTSKAVVVFQAEGSIPATDKSQLLDRIVNPILDYYEETADDSPIVSLNIEPNTGTNKNEYPYLGTIIFANGGNNGFVITKKEGSITWWTPDCMICVFSESYKTKYPEVVARSL